MFAMENALSHDAPPPMTSLKQGFHLFTGRTLRQLGANDVQLQEAVDIMGKRSARAQGLKKAITSYVQMTTSDHRLFLLVARGGALKGMMRVGPVWCTCADRASTGTSAITGFAADSYS